MRGETNYPSDFNLICLVQPSHEKYSASAVGQISTMTPRVSPELRGGSRSSRTLLWDAVDAGVATDERGYPWTAKSCGSGAPTLALSSRS